MGVHMEGDMTGLDIVALLAILTAAAVALAAWIWRVP